MGKAARAIIIEDGKLLVMHRNKNGSLYYTLVGGTTNAGEPVEDALVREVKEETGLDVMSSRLVFVENHPEPYNQQYIFICEVAPHESVGIQASSEEALLNRIGINKHTLVWVNGSSMTNIPFRTPQLQAAIIKGLQNGFPEEPVKL